MQAKRLRDLLQSFRDDMEVVVVVPDGENPVRRIDEVRWVEVVVVKGPGGLTKVRIKDPNDSTTSEETYAALALTVIS